ncbi:hypothetical protein PG993_005181 [Apiospora rasikravindrae]|uniref:Uncharacterized protein n=1 Tax=Apiospora rasikravindrae TaxID=990691 RepID=A0ABR1TFH3_9PEZI
MKVRFELTAALVASSVHLAQCDNVRAVARDQGAGPPRLGMPHPRQASSSLHQQRDGAACDIASIRAATERIQQLLSEFCNVSAAAVEQLESMETLLQNMGGAADDFYSSSSVTYSAGGHSHTTSASPSRGLTSTPAPVVLGGSETGLKDATTISGSSILTSTAVDSNQIESSKSTWGSASTERIAMTSTLSLTTNISDVVGSAQTLSRSSTGTPKSFATVISTAILPDSSQIRSSRAGWESQRATKAVTTSSSTPPSSTTRSLGAGLTASNPAPDRASGGSSHAGDQVGSATGGFDRESTVTIIPTETRIITVFITSRASFVDLISSLTSSFLKIDPVISISSTVADTKPSINSQRIPSSSATASRGRDRSRNGSGSSSGPPTAKATGKPLLSNTTSANGSFSTTPTSNYLSSTEVSGTTLLSTSNIRFTNTSSSSRSVTTVTSFLNLATRSHSSLGGSSSIVSASSAVTTTSSIRGSITTMPSFHDTSVDSRGSTGAVMSASASVTLSHSSPSDEGCCGSGYATRPQNSSRN